MNKGIKMLNKPIIGVVCLIALQGCATILSGRSQTLTVQSNPPGARCELTREGRIIGTVESTPGAVTIDKTKHDITIICKKLGYTDANQFAESGTEGSVFGNILLGGVIGWGIDSASGTDNKYPDVTTVNMVAGLNTSTGAAKSYGSETQLAKLNSLKQMRDQDLLTEQEYERKKAQILKNM